MLKEGIEKIVLARGYDKGYGYRVAITFGTGGGFCERHIPNLEALKAYIMGLIDSNNYTIDQVKNMRRFGRNEKQPDYFYIGRPLSQKEFQEIKKDLSPETEDRNGYC